MKWIFVWLGLTSITLAAAASSCSINHRSGQFECERTQDCDPGRTCSEGLCVTSGSGGPIDGGPIDGGPKPDASSCPAPCTSCQDGKVCVIDCAYPSAGCGAEVVCPAGFNCDIRCSYQGACQKGINCSDAASCAIQCTGRGSCAGVMCGPGRCDVSCSAASSCATVSCGSSCACDVRCPFLNGSCASVQCTKDACDTGRGCTSLFPTCNTCL